MAIIHNRQQGADISLINTAYHYPRKNEDGKWSKDNIMIVYKDNITKKKNIEIIEEPDFEFYMANDDVYIPHNIHFIEKEKVHKVTTKFSSLEKTIAELTGNQEFFYNNINSGNRRENRRLHTLPRVFCSDANIEDQYRWRFSKEYTNNISPLKKGYFDLEVDTIDMAGDFPEMGECPVNAISYIDDSTKTINVFLLRNKKNPLIEEFEKSIGSKLFNDLRSFICETVGGIDKFRHYGLDQFGFKFFFYDEEIQLIQDFFTLVNINEPDFMVAWNMAFDIPYLVNRIIALGYKPEDIMCHKCVPDKFRVVHYYIDEKNKGDFGERTDYYDISGLTVWLDQMIQFASRRKGQSAFDSYKLDDIGECIAKVNKLDYSHITTSLTKLPYLNYLVFVFYNIVDTIVQKCIEMSVEDLDFVYGKCTVNHTRYSKCHRQTVYLKNRAMDEYFKEGYVIGNNINLNNPKVAFPGALVGDPTHNSNYSLRTQLGETLNIADNLCDYDYKSLYPITTCQNNIGPNTQIGKIKIDNKVHDLENIYDYTFYDRGGQYIEDYVSGETLEFAKRWLHFGGYEDILNDIIEYFTKVKVPSTPILQVEDDGIKGIYYHNPEAGLRRGINYDNYGVRGISYYPKKLDYEHYINNIKPAEAFL